MILFPKTGNGSPTYKTADRHDGKPCQLHVCMVPRMALSKSEEIRESHLFTKSISGERMEIRAVYEKQQVCNLLAEQMPFLSTSKNQLH